MKPYFELHITIDRMRGEYHSAQYLIEALGWKYSRIYGDPALGEGAREYATMHADTTFKKNEVVFHMNEVARALEFAGFTVVRQKVEFVMYDTKGDK